MVEQLTLGFELQNDYQFDAYYPNGNQQLIDVLQQMAMGRGESFVYCWGNSGCGRTHLLQAACHEADKLKLSPFYLSLKSIDELTPDIFDGLEKQTFIAIDDLHYIAGRPAWEEAFFHCYNRIHEQRRRLLISADQAPANLSVALPDLVSRLAWSMTFQLASLDDDNKQRALKQRASYYGLTLSDSVTSFLLRHAKRDTHDLFDMLKRLNHASMVEKRKLTVPFVKAYLNSP